MTELHEVPEVNEVNEVNEVPEVNEYMKPCIKHELLRTKYMTRCHDYIRGLTDKRDTQLELIKSLSAMILMEKSFSEESRRYDPLIPTFSCPISYSQFKKESEFKLRTLYKDQSIPYEERLESIEYIIEPNEYFETLKSIFADFVNKRDRINVIRDDYIIREVCKRPRNIVKYYCGPDDDFLFTITIDIYNKLKDRYYQSMDMTPKKIFDYDLHTLIIVLILRYRSVSEGKADGLQWSIDTKIMEDIQWDLNVAFELFGSPINVHQLNGFCSVFPDIDSYFGSSGSYIDNISSISGMIHANPPFTEPFQDNFAENIISELDKNDRPLGIFGVIANWDDSVGYKMIDQCKYLCSKHIGKSVFESKMKNKRHTDLIFDVYHFLLMNDKMKDKFAEDGINPIDVYERHVQNRDDQCQD